MRKNKTVRVLHWIPMGMFPATLCFSSGFSYEELVDLLKKKKSNDWLSALEGNPIHKEAGNCGSQVTMENLKTKEAIRYYFVIMKSPFEFSDRNYCVLAHEILHVCQFFLPTILNREKEYESEAYLHTYLMEQCLKSIRG